MTDYTHHQPQYAKRYAFYAAGVAVLVMLNISASVLSMYSGSEQKMVANSLEQLRSENTQLEVELALLQQTQQFETIAQHEGYVDSQEVLHVSYSTTYSVAQR